MIDSTGYTGLLVSKNMLVKNNVVSNSCLTLNDGGGIDIDDADGMQVLDNIVVNTFGNVESSYSNSRYGNGIYFGPNVTKTFSYRAIRSQTTVTPESMWITSQHPPTISSVITPSSTMHIRNW